ncbi:MAG: hypothetical protein DIZ80_17285 [endosymbiont of Galathealinum brachiosum]|uniref:YdbS-like PH domain-containing protein n=1 Tax=endosymbiont of Galathealinum brachiosum TaxID=2200906 RepID=A0A370D9B5_9GAMM|nr:MAG: hypothetical protein DIZ80_17285 [endosymbiont of Galathealinum brachiosum]
MSYIESSLLDGEKIRELFNFHWSSKVLAIVMIPLIIPSFGIALIIIIREYIKLVSTDQCLTDQRIILKTGILTYTTDIIELPSIKTVTIDQNFFGSIFNFGSVIISDNKSKDITFKYVDNPINVKNTIDNARTE